VDDSKSIRSVVGITLGNANYNVLEGIDGEDALKHLNGSDINLVITDINMPNKNGIELIKDIRSHKDYRFTPILVLTTESQMDNKVEAKSVGATGWIVKTFIADKLLTEVKKLLGNGTF